jgi:hypothetical protein
MHSSKGGRYIEILLGRTLTAGGKCPEQAVRSLFALGGKRAIADFPHLRLESPE